MRGAVAAAAHVRHAPSESATPGQPTKDSPARTSPGIYGNPAPVPGLEPAAIFLTKSEEAVRNLAQAFRTDGLSADSRLLQTARRLRKWGISALIQTALHSAEPRLRRNLLSANPSLRAFDLLKLSWLLKRL